jgi:hypothetical protein
MIGPSREHVCQNYHAMKARTPAAARGRRFVSLYNYKGVYMKNILVLGLLAFSLSLFKWDQTKDYLAVPGPLKLDSSDCYLCWS